MFATNSGWQRTTNLFVLITLCLGIVVVIFPFLYMVTTSLQGEIYTLQVPPEIFPSKPTLDNFATAFGSRNFTQGFMNSFGVAISTSLLTVTLSSMMAFGFARFKFPGKNVMYFTLLFMLMIPGLLFIVPQFILANRLGFRNSLPALSLVYSVGNLAFQCFLLRGFFESLPHEIEEAALIDGANMLTIFLRIILPLSTPALSTVAVFSFIGAWDEYFWALLMMINDPSRRTLPVLVAQFRGIHQSNWGLVFAGALIQTIPTIIVFILFQRYFVQGLTAGAVKQ